jgi:hypothetical protein
VPGPFARIEALLGVRTLYEVGEESLRGLIDGAVREDADLDFKETLYGAAEKDKRSLAGDVAAFANTVGGVLVLGVRENDGIATQLVPVDVSEDEELRMRQALASWAAPVPILAGVHRVTSETGRGYFLLAVPRSPNRPHAVRVNQGLRYPVRSGPTTRYLSESEVADAYRNRFRIAEETVSRVRRVEREGLSRLDTSELRWLTLSLVPDSPGQMELRHRTVRLLQEWLEKFSYPPFSYVPLAQGQVQTYAGIRRIVAAQVINKGTGRSAYGHIELHLDGSGFAAIPVWSARSDEEVQVDLRLDDELLVGETTAMVDVLATHATANTHTSGTASVRASVVNHVRSPRHPSDILPMSLTNSRGFSRRHAAGPHSRRELPPSEHSLDLDAIVESRQELLTSVRVVLSDIFQAFGHPEVLQIDPEGYVRSSYINNQTLPSVQSWCMANAVKLVDTTVEAEEG